MKSVIYILDKAALSLVVFYCIVLVGCSSESKECDQLGRFVFVDDEEVCHLNKDCAKLKSGKDGHGHSMYAIQPCDTIEFMFGNSERICSNCVSVSDFEYLKAISNRNKLIEAQRKYIYSALVLADYDMEPYEEFIANISITERRKRLYKVALEEGWDEGTFDEFSHELGF